MHLEDIKADLRKRGTSIAQIARELGVHISVVSHVLRGKRSQRIETAIARALHQRWECVWSDRQPIKRRKS